MEQAKLFKAVETIVEEFDREFIDKAVEYFVDYVAKGIILTDDFDCDVWKTTDEYSNVNLNFKINHFQYNRNFESLFGITYLDFINYLKSYVILKMDANVLISLQTFLRDIKRIINKTKQNLIDDMTEYKISNIVLCIDFLSSLPSADEQTVNQFIEQLDNQIFSQYRTHSKQQRKLAQFQSYFLFNDILTEYWTDQQENNERMFYYPIYLWWQITAVVPLRPREFLLTQRNCLTMKDGKYYLTLRRNNLKGNDKGVSHKISEDYYLTTYEIPQRLAESIKEYLNLTKDLNVTQLDTLFLTDAHYQKFNRTTGKRNRFFTYSNLNTVLKKFYKEVIGERYNYHIYQTNPREKLEESEINFIHLGDTRHIAMINLIAENASPVTAMLLAGHDSVSTSAHYFANLSQFIECRSYQVYRKLTNSQTTYEISKAQPRYTVGKAFVQLDNKGRCYSPKYASGDYSDCLKVISKNAELGACTSCPFYRKAGKDFFSMDKTYKKSIDEEAMIVKQAINLVRKGKGNYEDIGEALLKLKTVSYSYQEYLTSKHITEGK